MNKAKLTVITAVFSLVILGLVFWYLQNKNAGQTASQQSQTQTSGIGGQIFEQTQNPIKNVLPANPFSNYKNPFSK